MTYFSSHSSEDDEIFKILDPDEREKEILKNIQQTRFTAQQKIAASHKLFEIENEKDLLRYSISEQSLIVHFYRNEFQRCHLLDAHLEVLFLDKIIIRLFLQNFQIPNFSRSMQ